MLTCSAIQELLPSYLERLTSPETTMLVDEHLEKCDNCCAVKRAIEMEMQEAHPSEASFSKKRKRRQTVGGILSALITLLCMFWVYSIDFNVDVSTASSLEAAIEEYNVAVDMDVDVVESKRVGKYLFVLYERADLFGNYGIAKLERGIFGKYRFHTSSNTNWQLYNLDSETVGKRNYLLIYGINDLPDAASFTIFSDFEKTSAVLYTGSAEHSPFLRIVETEERYSVWPSFIRYYDETGMELSERDLLLQLPDVSDGKAGTVGSAELGVVYALLAILFVLGIVFVRCFIGSFPWEKK